MLAPTEGCGVARGRLLLAGLRWMVMSLRARLTFLVVLAMLPSVVVHLGNGAMLRQDAEETVRQDAMRLLASLRGEGERVVEGVHLLLDGLAESEALRAGDGVGCQDYLWRVGSRLPQHLSILAADRQGRVLCASEPAMVGRDIGRREEVRGALRDGGSGLVGGFLRKDDAGVSIVFAKPYETGEGKIAGVVSASLDLSWLEARFAGMPLPDNATVTVADRDGTIIVRLPASDRWIGKRLPPDYLELMARGEHGVVHRSGLDGVDRVVAFSPAAAGFGDTFIAVGVDEASALAVIDNATRRGLLLVLLDLAAMLALAWIGVHHFIRRPAYRLMAAAGRWRDGDYSARADLGGDASEIGMLGSAFDRMAAALEDRERIREAAHEAERRMAAVLASTSDGVIEVDGDWRISFLNDRARQFFGGRRAASGDLLWDAFPEMRGTAFERRYRTAVSIQRPTEFEAFSGASGTWFAVRAFPTRQGLAIHLQDISARKAQEREIRRAEARHRAIVDTAADAMVLVDQSGVIRSCNRSTERIFGSPAETLVGCRIGVLLPGESGPPAACIGREVEGRRSDGAPVPLELSVADWHDGEQQFFTCILRDATQRREAEEALRAARDEAEAARAEAERANLTKSKFLAAASHDLRQPVQSLLLFSAGLSERLRGHPAVELVTSMNQCLDALRQLLDGLLDISRLDAGVVRPRPTEFPIGPLIERLGSEYALQARAKGLDLKLVPCGSWVRSDPALIERILRNLIENALRYTPGGRILIGCRRRSGSLTVQVLDTGIGIPADEIDAVFDEFHQLETQPRCPRGSGQGLGLGLATVRRLARLLGHAVTVRSEPGRGSVFTVGLPLAAPRHRAPAQLRPEEPAPDRRGLVVVIDDEQAVLDGICMLLQGWGYDVLAGRSCEDVSTLVQGGAVCPDVVLADYRLRGGGSGADAIHRVRNLCGERVPGIVLTGDTAPERAAEARCSGFSLIHKPVAPVDLRRVLARARGAR